MYNQNEQDDEDMSQFIHYTPEKDEELDMGLCQSFGYNFKGIGKILKHKEFSVTLLFFLIQGLLIPNFDDIHFVFLT